MSGPGRGDNEDTADGPRRLIFWHRVLAYMFLPWWGPLLIFVPIVFMFGCGVVELYGGHLSRTLGPLALGKAAPDLS